MKKQNLSSLVLRKSKISNLTRLANLIGGTDPETGSETVFVTVNTDCGHTCIEYCEHSIDNPTGCITNDKTVSLQTPTLVLGCEGLATGAAC